MKKGLSALFFVFIITTVFVTNAFAASAGGNRMATLKRVSYERGGITLLFHTSGLSKDDLNHVSLTVRSQQWSIACKFVDNSTDVRCRVSKRLSMYADETFTGTLAGFQFSGKVPNARTFPQKPAIYAPAVCEDGQTLLYTFTYFNSSYQTEVWSDHYLSPNAFHSIYGVYPESSSTYTDTYTDNGVQYVQIYYIYTYTTTDGGHGTTPADNWNALIVAYQAEGYTIQKTGESCGNIP